MAIDSGCLGAVRALVEAGCSLVRAQDLNGREVALGAHPIVRAITAEQFAVAEWLIGCDRVWETADAEAIPVLAFKYGATAVAEQALTRLAGDGGDTAAQWFVRAAAAGQLQICEWFLRVAHVDVNVQYEGSTAYEAAIRGGWRRTAEFLRAVDGFFPPENEPTRVIEPVFVCSANAPELQDI
jgi:hypothetical protein